MSSDMQSNYSARMHVLPSALDWVERCCQQEGVIAGDRLRLALIVEELFTNTVVHGHGGGSDAAVQLALAVDADHLTLHYRDSAPHFDPLRYLAEAAPNLDAQPEERPIGHMGLPLVAQMAERFDYAYVGGCNRMRVRLRRQG